MELSSSILSDIIVYSKYAKYISDAGRREVWEEVVDRYRDFFIKKYPKLANEITENAQFIYDKKILPSMRALQFAGKPLELNPARAYNCCATIIDSWEAFHEVMFLLLGGSGVTVSVQQHHIDKLPIVRKPTKRKRRFLIGDSIEGWSDAIKVLMKAYFNGESDPEFDYSDIRKKGTLLKTSGGRAPGPQPLKDCIHNIRKVLYAKESGDKLKPIEAHDIICYIADAVLSGGIRRAAIMTLFSIDDEEMLTAKSGNWWELNPQRARSNNSVVIVRHKLRKAKFMEIWERIKASGAGEPGFFFTYNSEWLTNPCGEIALRAFQMCNLTAVNTTTITDQEDFNRRARVAAFFGTLQAGLTDFHYLREIWQTTTEKEALIGVSLSGIASGTINKLSCKEAAEAVKTENKRVAKLIGINSAARCTTTKPDGTGALVLGASSGVHDWHAPYYIRRIRLNKTEALYKYLVKKLPELIEDDFYKPGTDAVLSIPIKAPVEATFRNQPVLNLLERIKKINIEWVQEGHRKGDNTHNVSCTVSIKDNEWEMVGDWIWNNRDYSNGISVLPYDGGSYKQMPFEDIDEKTYVKMMKSCTQIDLSEIYEGEDNTELKENVACAGGQCNITKA